MIGAINEVSGPDAIMLNAAGSMPGDLHKLWRTTHPKNFHMEYGNSCMGYEIAGGLGAKMAAPERDVFVIIGDGTYLMLSSELVTSVQEGVKLIVLIWDNGGFKSIGSLSRSLGHGRLRHAVHPAGGWHVGRRFGRRRGRAAADRLRHECPQPGLQRHRVRHAMTITWPRCKAAKAADRTTVVVIKNDRLHGVPGYESWWDVAVPEVSEMPSVQEARVAVRGDAGDGAVFLGIVKHLARRDVPPERLCAEHLYGLHRSES